jgi:hypothetical protein
MSRSQIYSRVRTRKKIAKCMGFKKYGCSMDTKFTLDNSDPNLSGNNLNLDFLKDLLQQMKLQFMTLVQNQIAKDEIVR